MRAGLPVALPGVGVAARPVMAQHPLHRGHRHLPVAILIHQAEAPLHRGGQFVAGEAAVAIGVGGPRPARAGRRLRGERRRDNEGDSE
jgi:hypothetical protein